MYQDFKKSCATSSTSKLPPRLLPGFVAQSCCCYLLRSANRNVKRLRAVLISRRFLAVMRSFHDLRLTLGREAVFAIKLRYTYAQPQIFFGRSVVYQTVNWRGNFIQTVKALLRIAFGNEWSDSEEVISRTQFSDEKCEERLPTLEDAVEPKQIFKVNIDTENLTLALTNLPALAELLPLLISARDTKLPIDLMLVDRTMAQATVQSAIDIFRHNLISFIGVAGAAELLRSLPNPLQYASFTLLHDYRAGMFLVPAFQVEVLGSLTTRELLNDGPYALNPILDTLILEFSGNELLDVAKMREYFKVLKDVNLSLRLKLHMDRSSNSYVLTDLPKCNLEFGGKKRKLKRINFASTPEKSPIERVRDKIQSAKNVVDAAAEAGIVVTKLAYSESSKIEAGGEMITEHLTRQILPFYETPEFTVSTQTIETALTSVRITHTEMYGNVTISVTEILRGGFA